MQDIDEHNYNGGGSMILKNRIVILVLLICFGISLVACNSAEAGTETLPENEIFEHDSEFYCLNLQWGMSLAEATTVVPLIAFPEENAYDDISTVKRAYFTHPDTIIEVYLHNQFYSVKPLYEFEYDELCNVSYTFSDLTQFDSNATLLWLQDAFGDYEEKIITAPSGESIHQYTWSRKSTNLTYSTTSSETQLTSASLNVMNTK